MWWLPRLRLAFARRPWLYWMLVVLCALVVARSITAAEASARRAARAWGATRRVWVVEGDVADGGNVRAIARDYPSAMLPAATLASLPDPPVAAHHLSSGRVLTEDDLRGAATIAADWVILAVPADHAPALQFGDRVTVFRDGRRECDGVVAASSADRVEVGMPADCAAAVSTDTAAAVVARRPG